jgi:hypothetical protein
MQSRSVDLALLHSGKSDLKLPIGNFQEPLAFRNRVIRVLELAIEDLGLHANPAKIRNSLIRTLRDSTSEIARAMHQTSVEGQKSTTVAKADGSVASPPPLSLNRHPVISALDLIVKNRKTTMKLSAIKVDPALIKQGICQRTHPRFVALISTMAISISSSIQCWARQVRAAVTSGGLGAVGQWAI